MKIKILTIMLLLSCITRISFAEHGITNNQITLGMSNALSGPASQLGIELRRGSTVYFDKLNRAGGIEGRKVKLISLDDGYEPVNTVINTRKLIEQENVFSLFGYVGTPTSFAIMPLIERNNIPYLMPFTGAEFLRSPINKNIFNLRASYYQEAQAQIDYLVHTLKIKNIGLLIQADEFGLAVEQGLLKAMKKYNIAPVVTTRYRRNTNDISGALAKLKNANIDAVSFVGTYEPMSEFINQAHQQDFKPVYTTVSFISSSDLFARIKYPSRILVTEVMPDPKHCQMNLCIEFLKDMKLAGFEQGNQIELEGYLNAHLFTQVAKLCIETLTRDCLIKKFESFSLPLEHYNLDALKSVRIDFSKKNHQGLSKVYHSFFESTP